MAKPHRGKGIRELFAHGRGECPVCKKHNVKVLYEMDAGEQKFKICKICKAAIKNGKKSLPVTVSTVTEKAPEPKEAAPEAKTETVSAAATAAAEEPAAEETASEAE